MSRPAREGAVADAAAPSMQVKKALVADPELAANIAKILSTAAPVTEGAGSQVISGSHISGNANQICSAGDMSITGRRGVSLGGDNSGIVSSGDSAGNVQFKR